jgi:hypothetical protein
MWTVYQARAGLARGKKVWELAPGGRRAALHWQPGPARAGCDAGHLWRAVLLESAVTITLGAGQVGLTLALTGAVMHATLALPGMAAARLPPPRDYAGPTNVHCGSRRTTFLKVKYRTFL